MSDHHFYTLPVKSVTPETEKAVTVAFEVPEEYSQKFQYKAGQYLTLKFNINGEEVRRAYSMCSSPLEKELAVTVKEVEKGKVSTYINRNLKAGASVEVMPPEGRFIVKPNAEINKTYYLFGAGSGITPLMSILKTIVEEEPKSTVFLLYSNRDEDNIIFEKELEQLQKRYSGQLIIEHILSQPKKEKSKGFAGMFSKGKMSWEGKVGRIDSKVVKDFLSKNPKRSKDATYYICGPGGMIDAVERSLKNEEIAEEFINIEHFTSQSDDEKIVAGAAGAKVTVHLNGETVAVQVPEKKTILDTLIKEGYDPPYSCTSGACSTCLAKVVKGEVKMEVYYAIDDDEVAQGYILTCQSHPVTKEVEITYEV